MMLPGTPRAGVIRVRTKGAAPGAASGGVARNAVGMLVGGPAVGAVVAAGNMWARRQAQQEVCRKEAKEQRKEPYIRGQPG